MKKRLILMGVVGTVLGGVGMAAIPLAVSAAASNSTSTTFISDLAKNLGIDQSKVQAALTQTQTDMKAQSDAKYVTSLNTAVSNGKLTQRQADILRAMLNIRPDLNQSGTFNKPDITGLSDAQIKADMATVKAQMDQKLVDALNAQGLKTSLSEVQAAQSAAKSIGIAGGFMGMRPFRGEGAEVTTGVVNQ